MPQVILSANRINDNMSRWAARNSVDKSNPVDALMVAAGRHQYAAVNPSALDRLLRSERSVLANVAIQADRHTRADAGISVWRQQS